MTIHLVGINIDFKRQSMYFQGQHATNYLNYWIQYIINHHQAQSLIIQQGPQDGKWGGYPRCQAKRNLLELCKKTSNHNSGVISA